LQRDVQRSQSRLESYHQLRSAIAQVGGKKELTSKTDIEVEISNQCVRLIANAIIYYNSAILSRLLTRDSPSPNSKDLAMIKKVSPAAWPIFISTDTTLSQQGGGHRSGRHRGGAKFAVTEISAVWAYTPSYRPEYRTSALATEPVNGRFGLISNCYYSDLASPANHSEAHQNRKSIVRFLYSSCRVDPRDALN
jgi:hypothetical protein